MRKLILAILIVAVLVVAGCTMPGQRETKVSATDGLIINEFSADPARVDEQESVSFLLEIENVGGRTAGSAEAKLLGAAGWDCGDITKTIGDLSPPDLTTEPARPGDLKIISWDCTSPDLPEGIINPYTITGRVRYAYHTSSAINIPVLTKSEYNRRMQKGTEIPPVTVTNTIGATGSGGAPVLVDMDPQRELLIDPDTPEEFSFRLVFNNAGSGVPIYTSLDGDEDGIITGTISVVGPEDVEFVDCIGAAGLASYTIDQDNDGDIDYYTEVVGPVTIYYAGRFDPSDPINPINIDIDGNAANDPDELFNFGTVASPILKYQSGATTTITISPGDLKIRRGESVKKGCSIRFSESADIGAVSIVMDLNYDYYVQSTANVQVVGK